MSVQTAGYDFLIAKQSTCTYSIFLFSGARMFTGTQSKWLGVTDKLQVFDTRADYKDSRTVPCLLEVGTETAGSCCIFMWGYDPVLFCPAGDQKLRQLHSEAPVNAPSTCRGEALLNPWQVTDSTGRLLKHTSPVSVSRPSPWRFGFSKAETGSWPQ